MGFHAAAMIGLAEFVERLCRVAADRSPRAFPRNPRDREILMQSLVMRLDSGRGYSEAQINACIASWKREIAPAIETDHVSLRRTLVDYGRLERSADGSIYRVGFPARMVAFDLDIWDLDLRATIAAYREQERNRRRPPGTGDPAPGG
jgi:hypothetical protein